jgi:DNA-directed RNA polymerase specialized sigma24 family protein
MNTNAQTGLLEQFICSQDADAFVRITRQYAGLVYGTCIRITGNADRAADATQETFFHLAKHARQVSGSLAGWLHHVAVGKSVNQVRSDVARRRREEEYAARPLETDDWSKFPRWWTRRCRNWMRSRAKFWSDITSKAKR